MKNIFLLRTDRPSFLFKDIKDNLMFNKDWIEIPIGRVNQNVYITSNEEPKHLDYYITKIKDSSGERYIVGQRLDTNDSDYSNCKKIILTNDTDLIKDGVQAIDDDFLEWFIKNPSCESVEVRKIGEEWIYNADVPKKETEFEDSIENSLSIMSIANDMFGKKEEPKQEFPQLGTKEFNNLASAYFGGKPKEEPKQETLEEAAEMNCVCKTKDCVHYKSFISGVKSDAARDYWFEKFKAERYNEEEVEELLNKRSFDLIHKRDTKTTNEWFDKYKKK